MAIPIVYLFESVQIKQHYRECGAMSLRPCNFIRQALLDVSPIEQACKGVQKSEFVELLRYLLSDPVNLYLLINHVDVEEYY
jgi:hypothetical protein